MKMEQNNKNGKNNLEVEFDKEIILDILKFKRQLQILYSKLRKQKKW